jgi:glucose 1-dehydrogenase
LLATLILRLRGIEVTAFGRTPRPYLNSDLVEALGAHYVSTQDVSLRDAAAELGPFDLIYEATGLHQLSSKPWKPWARMACWCWPA